MKRARFTQSFKIQAAEKVRCRAKGVSVGNVVDALGIGHSTLQKWVAKGFCHIEGPGCLMLYSGCSRLKPNH